MGRKTHESIGRALPNRRNIVISRNPAMSPIVTRSVLKEVGDTTCRTASSLAEAVVLADRDAEPFVIGGAAIYAEALPLVTRMYITEVHREVEGDVLFHAFDRAAWRETARVDGAECSWTTLERI
jgi:dihydrofolate reductase